MQIFNGGEVFSFQRWNGAITNGILRWFAGIRDHSWPLFCCPKLHWDTSTLIFMTSSAAHHRGFRIRLHDAASGKVWNHPRWEKMRMEFQSTICGLISVRSLCLAKTVVIGGAATTRNSSMIFLEAITWWIPIQEYTIWSDCCCALKDGQVGDASKLSWCSRWCTPLPILVLPIIPHLDFVQASLWCTLLSILGENLLPSISLNSAWILS